MNTTTTITGTRTEQVTLTVTTEECFKAFLRSLNLEQLIYTDNDTNWEEVYNPHTQKLTALREYKRITPQQPFENKFRPTRNVIENKNILKIYDAAVQIKHCLDNKFLKE